MDNDAILNQLPVDRAVCFANDKGEQSDKIRKQQTKLLAKLGPFVRKFLEPDERILYALPAVAPMSALEQFIKGWHVYYLKACALVFTSKRILYIPTDAGGKPRQSLAQARYGDIASFTAKGMLSGHLELAYKGGRKEKFTIQAMGEWKKINAFLPKLVPGGEPTDRRDRHFLCPRCVKPLTKGVYACPSCRLQFRTMAQAAKLALLVPGAAYFLTGHVWFGVLNVMAELFLVIFILSTLVAAHGKAELMAAPIFLVVLLAVHRFSGWEHARGFVAQYMPAAKV
ncbi:MAG: hypothetical protein MUF78_06340 [Candidatus Edwardsbacteria bacterium]|jgi:hypothetical protein|nr:hypothetical protein [Candidatus Edwardsbacteria bacterium]